MDRGLYGYRPVQMSFSRLSEETLRKLRAICTGDWTYREHFGGHAYRFSFANGFGASVVKHYGSYGHEVDLWELAVLDSAGNLHYDNPVACGDVLGCLDEEEVIDACIEISQL